MKKNMASLRILLYTGFDTDTRNDCLFLNTDISGIYHHKEYG
jgi:hypothetical protein